MRAQRNLLFRWQKMHPHRDHSKSTISVTDKQRSRYSTSHDEHFSHIHAARFISKEELDFKRAKILAKPSWLLPFYHPSSKLDKGSVTSSYTLEEETSSLTSEDTIHSDTTFSALT
jgi:hypothetical protein